MKTQPTIFNPELIEKAVIEHAKTIPGIKEVEVNLEQFNDSENHIIIDTWVSADLINVKASMYELQKLIYYSLNKKFTLVNLTVDIIVHIN